MIKRLSVLIFIVIIFSCKDNVKTQNEYENNQLSTEQVKIVFYKSPENKQVEYCERSIEKQYDTLQKIIYYYNILQENNDTISYHKNSIYINSQKLKFLDKKVFKIGNKNVVIDKYVAHNSLTSTNFYFKDNELVIRKAITSNIVVEYYNENNLKEIHPLVINDSVFFLSAW
jgi:hypothetical protein